MQGQQRQRSECRCGGCLSTWISSGWACPGSTRRQGSPPWLLDSKRRHKGTAADQAETLDSPPRGAGSAREAVEPEGGESLFTQTTINGKPEEGDEVTFETHQCCDCPQQFRWDKALETPKRCEDCHEAKRIESEEPTGKGDKRTKGKGKREESSGDTKTVFVGGLPHSTTEEALAQDFAECGEIVSLRMPRKGAASKGFAFITYNDEEAMERAMALNKTDYGGRTIAVIDAAKGKGKDGHEIGRKYVHEGLPLAPSAKGRGTESSVPGSSGQALRTAMSAGRAYDNPPAAELLPLDPGPDGVREHNLRVSDDLEAMRKERASKDAILRASRPGTKSSHATKSIHPPQQWCQTCNIGPALCRGYISRASLEINC